jgi:hypothetical protein
MQFVKTGEVIVGEGVSVGVKVWLEPGEVAGMDVNVCGVDVKAGVEVFVEAILFSASANERPPTTSKMEIKAYKRPLPSWRAACIILIPF